MLVKLILILICLTNINAFYNRKSMNKLRERVKNIYKSEISNKDKMVQFLGYDPKEFPGSNEEYRAIHRAKWSEYYSCLERQSTPFPEAILGLEGGKISFECKVCISPLERSNFDSITWFWAGLNHAELRRIEVDEHILISPEDKTLQLFNLHKDNSGQYTCHLGSTLIAPYFLTVVDLDSLNFTKVHPVYAPSGPHPQPSESIEKSNIILDTQWNDWSSCSKCNEIGRRFKFGYCTIFYDDETRLPNSTDYELIKIFKEGIPCQSHILPKTIQKLPQIQSRPNELMTGFCKVRCPEKELFEVIDKTGKVVETANNSAGVYSMLQGMPEPEPEVERRLLYAVQGTNLILNCPGNVNSDAPLHWQIARKLVVPELISRESSGRIFISITDRVHINKAKISDSNIYSCWQQNELAGTIRLVVENKFELKFNHHIMLLGLVIILGTFLYVFLKAFTNRKYAQLPN